MIFIETCLWFPDVCAKNTVGQIGAYIYSSEEIILYCKPQGNTSRELVEVDINSSTDLIG